ncbi:MAG: SpoIVB peptidase S55 domain-containing protein, partial [Anaerobutyricum soehngenii]
IKPVYSGKNNCYQIGVWIRNDTQGIGTITFIREDGTFAALGHGISDGDIGVQFLIEGGSAYRADIASILKGKAGKPGEVIGTINYVPQNYLGEIYANTTGGIFGKMIKNKKEFCVGEKLPVAKKSEIQTGRAYLRSSISGKSKEYSIEIEKIFLHEKDSLKTLKIKVTDPELIALTGGIIQGLSGSPILQNGKLVGAVTHVLIDNPKMGYGIFAESMLE